MVVAYTVTVVTVLRRVGVGERQLMFVVMTVGRVVIMPMCVDVGMNTHQPLTTPQMPVHTRHRGPGELERQDKHQDNGDDAVHANDSSRSDAEVKIAPRVSGCAGSRRCPGPLFVRRAVALGSD